MVVNLFHRLFNLNAFIYSKLFLPLTWSFSANDVTESINCNNYKTLILSPLYLDSTYLSCAQLIEPELCLATNSNLNWWFRLSRLQYEQGNRRLKLTVPPASIKLKHKLKTVKLICLIKKEKLMLRIRINQLTVSITRWQHVSRICFETYFVKTCKIINNSRNTKATENNKHRCRLG
jgi:hypothetical protein